MEVKVKTVKGAAGREAKEFLLNGKSEEEAQSILNNWMQS